MINCNIVFLLLIHFGKMARKSANMVDKYVGIKLKRKRLELHYTQDQLAEIVGLTFQQIQKYESGLNQIPMQNLYKFAELLGVEISYFFDNYELFFKNMKYINYNYSKNKLRLIRDVSHIIDCYVEIDSPKMRNVLQNIIVKSIDINRANLKI